MKSSVLFLVFMLVIVGLVVPLYFEGFMAKGETVLRRFSSREEIRNFVKASSRFYYGLEVDSPVTFFTRDLKTLGSMNSLESATWSSSSTPDYSKTNIQVEGVDEADIIKTDGEYMYIVSGRNVTILKVYPPEEAELLSQIALNGTISGVFINENKLVIFENGYYPAICYATFESKSFPYYGSSEKARIWVYDISNKANPVSTRNVTIDGYYFDSRMIGDYIYAVVNDYVHANESWVNLPIICYGGEIKEIGATKIYYSNVSDTFNTYTTIVAINTQDDTEEPTYETILLGATSNMYVSMNNIYITYQEYNGEPRPSPPITILPTPESAWVTTIHRIYIENGEIEYVASGQVPGKVLNQFSMDEFNGYFRIATTTGEVWGWGEATSGNHVYVLDMDLTIVGRLENLAQGEQIHSARFMGNRCYLVTFKKIDPLFVVDLSIPSEPTVLGQLKIPGYSDYLHPYDENHIIGVGKDTVEAEEGDFAWYQGIKITLFDVSDVEHPKEIDKYVIGDRGSDTPVLRDHKAFLFDRAKSLLVLPVLVAEIDEAKYPNGYPSNTYGDFVFQGAYVFNITLSEGLEFKGRITHLENDAELIKSGYYFDSSYSVYRSLYIDNVLYTISDKKIKMNSLEDLAEINEIELP